MSQIHKTSSASRPLPRLDCLPDEVIQTILCQLDALSLITISSTSRHFQAVASEQLIWKDLVLRDFRFWDDKHELLKKVRDASFRDWRNLYIVRHTANVATRRAVQQMIDDPIGRLAKVHRVLDHGYGIKDVLLELNKAAPNTDCVLAQRYWSQMVLACLNRSVALEQWTRVRYRSDVANPTETALACLDMFVLGPSAEGDINDTCRRLDEMVDAVRTAHPEIDEQTPRRKAIVIAEFLRAKKWVGIDEGRDYYSIEHQFLGFALRSPHRSSLPLISCVIYSYICRAFGLRAQPCNFPMHVRAVVQPPLPSSPNDPQLDLDNQPLPPNRSAESFADFDPDTEPLSDLTHLYVDPFNTATPTSLSRMQTEIHFSAPHVTQAQAASYLLPASPRSLLIRSAHNIVRSVQATPFDIMHRHRPARTSTNSSPNANDNDMPDTEISTYDAAYAALFALVMFPSSPQGLASSLGDLRQHYAHHFIEDLCNYENYILPLTTGVRLDGVAFGGDRTATDQLVTLVRREDSTPKRPKTRGELRPGFVTNGEAQANTQAADILWTVGTVFRHRRQGYIGVIYGWDARCEMGESWILGNGVDRLSRGRGQPFYNVL